ncbi:hypothetical protein GLOIN_2v1868421 [Rhizophagus clarus]|uniref:Uncharacterized protein n=1 Tax=Rhizophagus clarus TaxID=94130 RepID=A0A8H3LRG2_9GLOM|nr:hypothetical protein GLOIN_2v1868421 [Rhizophagus clarus]
MGMCIKMGLAQNPTLVPRTWSNNDFVIMKNTLQQCLSLIQKLRQLTNVLRPRKAALFSNGILIIDSRIVDYSIVSAISRWVDKIIDDNVELYLPYKFELLLRDIKGTEEILGGNIRGTEENFSIQDYEVFQITKGLSSHS